MGGGNVTYRYIYSQSSPTVANEHRVQSDSITVPSALYYAEAALSFSKVLRLQSSHVAIFGASILTDSIVGGIFSLDESVAVVFLARLLSYLP